MLALVGWHVWAGLQPPEDLNPGERALLAMTGPVQDGLSKGMRGTGGLADRYLLLVGTQAENVRLREELSRARSAIVELEELRQENDRLRAMVELRSRSDAVLVGATVIGRGTDSRFRTIRIDQGSRSGLLAGQAVLSVDGAVGQVLRAGARYADVLLLTDGLSATGALVQRTRLHGVAAGEGGGALELGFIRRSDRQSIAEGDQVVTSGDDGVFPPGVPVGQVVGVESPETGLFLEVELQPAAGLDRLEEVFVVIDRGTGPFALLDGEEAAAVAREAEPGELGAAFPEEPEGPAPEPADLDLALPPEAGPAGPARDLGGLLGLGLFPESDEEAGKP